MVWGVGPSMKPQVRLLLRPQLEDDSFAAMDGERYVNVAAAHLPPHTEATRGVLIEEYRVLDAPRSRKPQVVVFVLPPLMAELPYDERIALQLHQPQSVRKFLQLDVVPVARDLPQ
eukprot:980209-Prymnesium_polylepis.2